MRGRCARSRGGRRRVAARLADTVGNLRRDGVKLRADLRLRRGPVGLRHRGQKRLGGLLERSALRGAPGENGGGADLRFDHWRLQRIGERQWTHTPVRGPLSSNSGELVRDWCLAGHGVMLRSLWDVAPLLERGELVRVLGEWSMPDADIHWIAPYRAQVPRRIRLLVDFLAERFRDEPWRQQAASPVSAKDAPPGSRRKR